MARSQSAGGAPEQRVAQRPADDVRRVAGVPQGPEQARGPGSRRSIAAVDRVAGQFRPRKRYVRQASLRSSARYGVNSE